MIEVRPIVSIVFDNTIEFVANVCVISGEGKFSQIASLIEWLNDVAILFIETEILSVLIDTVDNVSVVAPYATIVGIDFKKSVPNRITVSCP